MSIARQVNDSRAVRAGQPAALLPRFSARSSTLRSVTSCRAEWVLWARPSRSQSFSPVFVTDCDRERASVTLRARRHQGASLYEGEMAMELGVDDADQGPEQPGAARPRSKRVTE